MPVNLPHQQPIKTFEGHDDNIISFATFPEGKRIATGSVDKTIRIWKLEDGTEMMKWEVSGIVGALIILRNGKYVVSAEGDIEVDLDNMVYWQLLWVRDAETGEVAAGPLDGHTKVVITLDISPDGRMLASGSTDRTVILWDTSTWQRRGAPLLCGAYIYCVQFSPTGQLGVATTENIQIWDLDRTECLAQFNDTAASFSLTWTRDGARLLSGGSNFNPVIRSWDTSTWKQAGDPWTGHDEDGNINHIALNTAGTLLASASGDSTVRLWQLSTGKEVAQFQHSHFVFRVAFSINGCFIFSGGCDKKVSQWEIPEQVLAAVRGDPLASKKYKVGSLRGKQQYMKGFFNSAISGQHRNKPLNYERIDRSRIQATHSALPRNDAKSPSSFRLHGVKSFFNHIRPSSINEGKQKAPEVIDVPLGQATYGDAVGVDDGQRQYVLFFCLSWFQKKKKPDPPRPIYDDELEDDESDEGILSVPIPTTQVQSA